MWQDITCPATGFGYSNVSAKPLKMIFQKWGFIFLVFTLQNQYEEQRLVSGATLARFERKPYFNMKKTLCWFHYYEVVTSDFDEKKYFQLLTDMVNKIWVFVLNPENFLKLVNWLTFSKNGWTIKYVKK